MAVLEWDLEDERIYRAGVDHCVLYIPSAGVYSDGVAWNGITAINETPSGAEATPIYADNIKYLNLQSVEEFGGTIEAITFPDEFYQFDGGAVVKGGIVVGQQGRGKFGLSYRTRLGDAVVGDSLGYEIHLVYGAQAAPAEKGNATINDTPETSTFSWEFTTTPLPVPGMRPSAQITINSTKVVAAELQALETILYGAANVKPKLPTPTELMALFPTSGTVVG